MALAVPLSRFTSQVGGGSAFFVRPNTRDELRGKNMGFRLGSIYCWHASSNRLLVHLAFCGTDRWPSCIALVPGHSFSGVVFYMQMAMAASAIASSSYAIGSFSWAGDWNILFRHYDSRHCQYRTMRALWPNKSPEPTAVGAGRSAIAVHATSRRWLSFLR